MEIITSTTPLRHIPFQEAQRNSVFLLTLAARLLPTQPSMSTSPVFKKGEAVTWIRQKGKLHTNVRQVVGDAGFDIGNSSEEASNFALNILTAIFPPNNDPIPYKNSFTSRIAWKYRQDFMITFLCESGGRRGSIPWAKIAKWIKKTIIEEVE